MYVYVLKSSTMWWTPCLEFIIMSVINLKFVITQIKYKQWHFD